MPIYLPPISRRRFFSRTITAGAGVLLAPALLAARRKTDDDSWALLSDIHIAADAKKVARNINMTDNFVVARKEILALEEKPSNVLISGDLAFNSGEATDYTAVTNLIQPFREDGMPLLLAMGNHDNRERFWAGMKSARFTQPKVHDRQVALIKTKRANWFVLDSLIKTLHTPGVVGEEQRAWLADALDSHSDKPAIIVVHHNPIDCGLKTNLEDSKEMFDLLRPRKHVKAWVFGHTHHWGVTTDESGIHLINLPPVAYVFEPDQPNGWVHATFKSDGARLELRCLDAKHPAHGQVRNLKWRA